MEDLIQQEIAETNKGPSERPYIASMSLFPIKIVLDRMQKEET